MAKLVLNTSAIERLLRSPTGPVQQKALRTAEKVAARARELAPVRTGRYRDSIHARLREGSPFGAVVTANVAYSQIVEGGSQPHPIRPRGNALVFSWPKQGFAKVVVPKKGGFLTHIDRDGTLLVGKGRVDHPGTKPQHILTRALSDIMGGA